MQLASATIAKKIVTIANPHGLPLLCRALDVLGSLIALPILGVGVLVMTVVTRCASPGPVLFRQERIGRHGQKFTIFKFRTMTVNADQNGHQKYFKELIGSNAPMVKLDASNDARIIPGAWILRATGLDELPQIINVLRGDMSLVGPRPCTPSEFSAYLPVHRERVVAVPGLTGLWQVSGKNRTTFDEMIRLDIHYARNASLPLNLKIIGLTPWALAVQVYDTCTSRRPRAQAPTNGSRAHAAPILANAPIPSGQRVAVASVLTGPGSAGRAKCPA